ncbi:MAG: hypothetical protein ABSG68_18985, partial [Thermoguttaceae bacterium]
ERTPFSPIAIAEQAPPTPAVRAGMQVEKTRVLGASARSDPVLPGDRIKTIRPDLDSDEETPFEDFPEAFERRPLRLDPIPRDVANLVILGNDFDFDWLSPTERDRLSQYLGK